MKIRTAATAALTLAATLTLAGCATGAGQGPMPGMDHGASATPVDANEADVMFASMMIVHHQQAIEMSDIVLAKTGIAPEVVELAEAIKAAQRPEIELLRGWLDDWGAESVDGVGGMDHGDGMMTDDDLAALAGADGAEASPLFLEQMIVHHRGALEMAKAEVDAGRNADAVELARTIIAAQTGEIERMQDLLGAR